MVISEPSSTQLGTEHMQQPDSLLPILYKNVPL